MGSGKYNNVPRYLREDVIADKVDQSESKKPLDKQNNWYRRKAEEIKRVVGQIKDAIK